MSFVKKGMPVPSPNPDSGGDNHTLSNLSTTSGALMFMPLVSQHLEARLQGWSVFASISSLVHQWDLKWSSHPCHSGGLGSDILNRIAIAVFSTVRSLKFSLKLACSSSWWIGQWHFGRQESGTILLSRGANIFTGFLAPSWRIQAGMFANSCAPFQLVLVRKKAALENCSIKDSQCLSILILNSIIFHGFTPLPKVVFFSWKWELVTMVCMSWWNTLDVFTLGKAEAYVFLVAWVSPHHQSSPPSEKM